MLWERRICKKRCTRHLLLLLPLRPTVNYCQRGVILPLIPTRIRIRIAGRIISRGEIPPLLASTLHHIIIIMSDGGIIGEEDLRVVVEDRTIPITTITIITMHRRRRRRILPTTITTALLHVAMRVAGQVVGEEVRQMHFVLFGIHCLVFIIFVLTVHHPSSLWNTLSFQLSVAFSFRDNVLGVHRATFDMIPPPPPSLRPTISAAVRTLLQRRHPRATTTTTKIYLILRPQ